MKKIIVLCGAERSGKTTTLNLVIEKAKKDKSFNIIKEVEISNNDKNALFYYKGKKIAITTAGDTKKIITDNFRFCKPCDILLTGLRKEDKLIKELENNVDDKEIIEKIDKAGEIDTIKRKVVNDLYAEKILGVIKKATYEILIDEIKKHIDDKIEELKKEIKGITS